MFALRGEVFVATAMVEAVVTVVEGLSMPRLRFRADEGTRASSMSETPDEPMDESEELSLPTALS